MLTDLQSRGRGVVLATVHYGDWELACLNSGLAGLPIMMVTEPLANPRLTAMFDRLRGCTGNKVVPPKYAVLKLFRGLRRGERVAVMCDVNGRRGRGGVWADFFGRPVFNGVAAAELALRTNAAVVFVASMPQPGGRHVGEGLAGDRAGAHRRPRGGRAAIDAAARRLPRRPAQAGPGAVAVDVQAVEAEADGGRAGLPVLREPQAGGVTGATTVPRRTDILVCHSEPTPGLGGEGPKA